MNANVIVLGWNRNFPGREAMGAEHFQQFVQYLQAQKTAGNIESFDPVLLEPTAGSSTACS
jgi:hypothetical protein